MAYNSQQLTLQQPKEPQGFPRRLLTKGQVFPFTQANRVQEWTGKRCNWH